MCYTGRQIRLHTSQSFLLEALLKSQQYCMHSQQSIYKIDQVQCIVLCFRIGKYGANQKIPHTYSTDLHRTILPYTIPIHCIDLTLQALWCTTLENTTSVYEKFVGSTMALSMLLLDLSDVICIEGASAVVLADDSLKTPVMAAGRASGELICSAAYLSPAHV